MPEALRDEARRAFASVRIGMLFGPDGRLTALAWVDDQVETSELRWSISTLTEDRAVLAVADDGGQALTTSIERIDGDHIRLRDERGPGSTLVLQRINAPEQPTRVAVSDEAAPLLGTWRYDPSPWIEARPEDERERAREAAAGIEVQLTLLATGAMTMQVRVGDEQAWSTGSWQVREHRDGRFVVALQEDNGPGHEVELQVTADGDLSFRDLRSDDGVMLFRRR